MTERLSDKNPCKTCQKSCSLDYECEERANYEYDCIKKLAEYETAEDEGRLVVFPCKVGDILFCIGRVGIHQFKVLSIEIYEYGAILELLYAGNMEKHRFWRIYMESYDFGRKLFLTSEEAEKALKEMRKDE